MKIDRKLNIVMKLDRMDGSVIHIHATPIGREVFETYYRVIAQTYTSIMTDGFGVASGPKVAMMILKEIAQSSGRWEGVNGVERGLLSEIKRLSNVIAPSPEIMNGSVWQTLPLELALQRDMIDEEDVPEVMNALVFFTVISCMPRRQELPQLLDIMRAFWGAEITSSSVTDYLASLPTSKPEESSGEKATQSSIPI